MFDEKFMTTAVLVDYKNGDFGSASFLADSLHVFLVTARHVIYIVDSTGKRTNKLHGDTAFVTTYSDNIGTDRQHKLTIDLKNLDRSGLIFSDSTRDVAVLWLADNHNGGIDYNDYVNTNESRHLSVVQMSQIARAADVKYGMDIFFLGYPKSLRIITNQLELNKPLLTRGIIAGKNSINQTIILNAQVHHGNSGGPVWGAFPNEFKVIGIVTELIPFESEIFQNAKQVPNVGVFNNSDFSVVQPIDHIMALLDLVRKKAH